MKEKTFRFVEASWRRRKGGHNTYFLPTQNRPLSRYAFAGVRLDSHTQPHGVQQDKQSLDLGIIVSQTYLACKEPPAQGNKGHLIN
jgi:hypothetical protein